MERPGKGGARGGGSSQGSSHRLPSLFAVVIALLLWAAVVTGQDYDDPKAHFLQFFKAVHEHP